MRLTKAMILKNLAAALRTARQDAGFSIKEVAANTGFSTQMIQNAETANSSYPASDYLFGLLEAYGLRLRDFEDLLWKEAEPQVAKQVRDLEKRVAALEQRYGQES